MSIKKYPQHSFTALSDVLQRKDLRSLLDFLSIMEKDLYNCLTNLVSVANKRLSVSTTWNPANLADGATATKAVTVTGAVAGDTVAVGFSSIAAGGWFLSGSVTGNDTVTVTLLNKTGAPVDLASGTLNVDVWSR